MNPHFPIYIVSKGRWESRLTVKVFEMMRAPYRIVVEEQEYKDYCSVIDKRKVLVLDKAFQRDYDTFDTLGDSISKGSGPARNFAWEHSIANGAKWHWVMDDNIRGFYRLFGNTFPVSDATIFRCMEDFVLRYSNVAMAGPQYKYFPRARRQPLTLNHRIYSCNLIRNDIGFRWRGRYNEDTDLSLRILKAGWCTVLFNAFLQNKMRTLSMKGGNTTELYADGKRKIDKSRMLVMMHPDVTHIAFKWKRWHHSVSYAPFAKNKLILKPGLRISKGVDNYGMRLVNAGSLARTSAHV